VPEEPGLADVMAEQQELLSRLRAVVEAKDAENAVLRRELDAEQELRGQLALRLAELERRLSMDSSDSGTPSSRERIGAKEARRARQQPERERSKNRKRGGQSVQSVCRNPYRQVSVLPGVRRRRHSPVPSGQSVRNR
jgi:septal ring factor EnvC (AmiA/AmiB activator)